MILPKNEPKQADVTPKNILIWWLCSTADMK